MGTEEILIVKCDIIQLDFTDPRKGILKKFSMDNFY